MIVSIFQEIDNMIFENYTSEHFSEEVLKLLNENITFKIDCGQYRITYFSSTKHTHSRIMVVRKHPLYSVEMLHYYTPVEYLYYVMKLYKIALEKEKKQKDEKSI